jgi:hypothetical protein
LFEKAKARPIDLAIDEKTHEAFMAQAGCEGQLALGYVKRGFRVTQSLVMQPRDVFERRIAHRRVVTIDVECAHTERLSTDYTDATDFSV